MTKATPEQAKVARKLLRLMNHYDDELAVEALSSAFNAYLNHINFGVPTTSIIGSPLNKKAIQ